MQHIPIIYSEDYTVSLEFLRRDDKLLAFIHADIRTWNKSTYQELQSQWKAFRQIYTQPIYALPPQENTAKFARLFGFKPLGNIMRHRV
jgi:hypothetical protein